MWFGRLKLDNNTLIRLHLQNVRPRDRDAAGGFNLPPHSTACPADVYPATFWFRAPVTSSGTRFSSLT